MTDIDEINGRLAALESAVSLALAEGGLSYFASPWPQHMPAVLQQAISDVRQSLNGDPADAAEQSLTRMFSNSITWIGDLKGK